MRVLIVGPTRSPWAEIAEGVEADLARLSRPGVDVAYRCTGAGPAAIRTSQDAIDAAPHVVRTVTQAAGEGFDAVIVDCTDDPGVEGGPRDGVDPGGGGGRGAVGGDRHRAGAGPSLHR
jgi:Asp/Glu/hydantoin racemase